jgi:hypothetical protein
MSGWKKPLLAVGRPGSCAAIIASEKCSFRLLQKQNHHLLLAIDKAECACLSFCQDNRCDQIATYDKKHVYANKAPAEIFKASVVQNYRKDSDGSQAIYFSTVAHTDTRVAVFCISTDS